METIIKLPDGTEVRLASATEAAVFMREYAGSKPAQGTLPLAISTVAKRQPPKRNGHDEAEKAVDPHAAAMGLSLLRLLKGSPDGVGFDRVMGVLGARTGKAIGSRAAMINKAIRSVGFDERTAYVNRKTAKGRRWQASRRIDDVIAALEQHAG